MALRDAHCSHKFALYESVGLGASRLTAAFTLPAADPVGHTSGLCAARAAVQLNRSVPTARHVLLLLCGWRRVDRLEPDGRLFRELHLQRLCAPTRRRRERRPLPSRRDRHMLRRLRELRLQHVLNTVWVDGGLRTQRLIMQCGVESGRPGGRSGIARPLHIGEQCEWELRRAAVRELLKLSPRRQCVERRHLRVTHLRSGWREDTIGQKRLRLGRAHQSGRRLAHIRHHTASTSVVVVVVFERRLPTDRDVGAVLVEPRRADRRVDRRLLHRRSGLELFADALLIGSWIAAAFRRQRAHHFGVLVLRSARRRRLASPVSAAFGPVHWPVATRVRQLMPMPTRIMARPGIL